MNRSLLNTAALFIACLALGATAHAAKSPHNPNFLRKLADPAHYKFNKNIPHFESICGTNDLVDVIDYDGSRGQPVEFVARKETAVAALAYGNVEDSKKYCSGTMISENLFLTASHCIDSGILQEFAVFNYQKMKEQEGTPAQEHIRVIEVIEQGKGGLDYAIIKLEGAPGLKYGFSPINVNTVQDGHLLTIIQHPSGRPKMVDMGNRNGTRGLVYMTYGNLDTEPGSSGSGVLDETGHLVGVHTNGGCFGSSGENAGVMMTEIVKHSPTIQALTGTKPEPPAQPPTEPPTQPGTPTDPVPPMPRPI